ncbi:unnamed protein product, partial [Hymenolepis diminuta]
QLPIVTIVKNWSVICTRPFLDNPDFASKIQRLSDYNTNGLSVQTLDSYALPPSLSYSKYLFSQHLPTLRCQSLILLNFYC